MTEEFELYRSRLEPEPLPAALQADAPVPPTWTGTAEEWEEAWQRAIRALAEKPAYDFAHAIGVQGYFPSELASGQLRPGAQVNAVTGEVVRPAEPTIPPEAERRARAALRRLQERGLKIDGVLQHNLELAAWGRYQGNPKSAKAAIVAAESAVAGFDAERQAAAQEEAERPTLAVLVPFRAKGKSYAPGTYRVDPAVADELRDWRVKMEAQAREHDWEAPVGFNENNWPPFSLDN